MEYVNSVSELNYMTQIVIMLYENPTKVSVDLVTVILHFLSISWMTTTHTKCISYRFPFREILFLYTVLNDFDPPTVSL